MVLYRGPYRNCKPCYCDLKPCFPIQSQNTHKSCKYKCLQSVFAAFSTKCGPFDLDPASTVHGRAECVNAAKHSAECKNAAKQTIAVILICITIHFQ